MPDVCEEHLRTPEKPRILVFAKKITASGFLLLIIAGNFWIYYQLFQRQYPPFLDILSTMGIAFLATGVTLYTYAFLAQISE